MTRADGVRDGRPHRDDENEVIAQLIDRDADEQERIDTELDRRYRDSPMLSVAEAWAHRPYSPTSYLAEQQAAIRARLNHFAVPTRPDRPVPDGEPVASDSPSLGRDAATTTPAGAVFPVRPGWVVAPLSEGRPDRCRAVGRHTHTDRMESA